MPQVFMTKKGRVEVIIPREITYIVFENFRFHLSSQLYRKLDCKTVVFFSYSF